MRFLKHYTSIFIGAIIAFNVAFFTPTPVRADFFSEVLDAAATAGGWPSDLPSPSALIKLIQIAQGCVGDTSEQGLINCVNTAIQDPTIYNALGEDTVDKIDTALALYIDISEGNYLGLIKKLGKTAGCAAAAILTGVPVCALAELIADIGKAIYDALAEVLEFLDGLMAYPKYTADSWYEVFWAPHLLLGVSIQMLNTDVVQMQKQMDSLVVPMRDACYKFFRDTDDMSVKNANKTCDAVRDRFYQEINTYIQTSINEAVVKGEAEYDKKAPMWTQQWVDKCDVPAGVAQDIQALINTCSEKVKAAMNLGRDHIQKIMHVCHPADAIVYDFADCAKSAFNAKSVPVMKAAVKVNQDLVKAYDSNPQSGKNLLAALKKETQEFNAEMKDWMEECKLNDYQANCNLELKNAWQQCKVQISNLPISSGDFPKQADVDAMNVKCQLGYKALTVAYKNFATKAYSVAAVKNLCPTSAQASFAFYPAAVQSCKDTFTQGITNCAGGEPTFGEFFKNMKIIQTPAPNGACSNEIQLLKDRWGQDETLLPQVDAAEQSSVASCVNQANCIAAAQDAAASCRTTINTQANIVGIASASGLKKAIETLNKMASECIAKIKSAPKAVVEDMQLEKVVLESYGPQCPTDQVQEDCKKALVKAAVQCKDSGVSIAGLMGKDTASKYMYACKSKLDEVVKKYKQKSSLLVTNSGKATTQLNNSGKVQLTVPDAAQPAARKALKSNLGADAPSEEDRSTQPARLNAPSRNQLAAPPAADSRRGLPTSTETPAASPSPTITTRPNLALPTSAADQMKAAGCTASARTRGGYECKTADAMRACEDLKTAGKVQACKQVP